MKKLLARLVWLPLGLILVAFLVANRQLVAVSLDPISTTDPAFTTPALPLWLWLVTALLLGVFAGAGGMWMSARPARKKARAEHRELKALKKELAARDAAAPREANSATATVPTLKAS